MYSSVILLTFVMKCYRDRKGIKLAKIPEWVLGIGAIYPIKWGNSSVSFEDLFVTLIAGIVCNTKKVICPNPAPLNIGKRTANAAGWIFTKIVTITPIMPPVIADMRLKNTILHT